MGDVFGITCLDLGAEQKTLRKKKNYELCRKSASREDRKTEKSR